MGKDRSLFPGIYLPFAGTTKTTHDIKSSSFQNHKMVRFGWKPDSLPPDTTLLLRSELFLEYSVLFRSIFFFIRNINLNHGISQQNSPLAAVVTEYELWWHLVDRHNGISFSSKGYYYKWQKCSIEIYRKESGMPSSTEFSLFDAAYVRRKFWTSLGGWLLQSYSQHLDLKPTPSPTPHPPSSWHKRTNSAFHLHIITFLEGSKCKVILFFWSSSSDMSTSSVIFVITNVTL